MPSNVNGLRDLARTALAAFTVVGLTAVLAPIASLLSLKDERAPDPIIRFWSRMILKAAGIVVEVRGLERLPGEQCILACNHQSLFDVPVIMAHMPKHVRFVAKQQLFRIPIFAMALRALGNIEVDRTGGEKDREKIKAAASAVRDRVSILFFAEGTRSPDGILRPFKKGAASLALQAGVPVVPMAVAGTGQILRKGTRLIRSGSRAAFCVGDPISTQGLTFDDRDSLTHRTRTAVAALLKEANAAIGLKPTP